MILQVRPKHLLPIDGQRYTPSTKTWQFGTLKKYGTSRVGKKIVVAMLLWGKDYLKDLLLGGSKFLG